MKAPRIVQSYWSKAYQNTPNSGWAFRESHYMSWALSCLQLMHVFRFPILSCMVCRFRICLARLWQHQ